MEWRGNLVEIGRGQVEHNGTGWRLFLPSASSREYSDAQLDDTGGLGRRQFLWRPPLTLSLRARFSHPAARLRGTAGFGFWNVPFGPGSAQVPALPRAAWFFFGAAPHDIPIAYGVPGNGWKAACLDLSRPAALPWAPLAPLTVLAMQNAAVYRWLWPRIQRSLGIAEAQIPAALDKWHNYLLRWRPDGVEFWVDDELMISAPTAPRGPLGFVAWIDNQYAIVSPRGRFGWGLSAVTEPQYLEIHDLRIEPASS